jgi:hypothetical protein
MASGAHGVLGGISSHSEVLSTVCPISPSLCTSAKIVHSHDPSGVIKLNCEGYSFHTLGFSELQPLLMACHLHPLTNRKRNATS